VPDSNGSPRVYQKQDGSHGASFEISASTVRFLSSRAETEGGYHAEETAGHVTDGDNDGIPF